MKKIHRMNNLCKGKLLRFGKSHPYVASALYFLALPVSMLAGIAAITTAVSVPVAMICGWLKI